MVKNKKWTEEETLELILLYNNGESYEKICKRLGRTKPACMTMIHNIRNGVDLLSKKIGIRGFDLRR